MSSSTGRTTIGRGTRIFPSAVIGGDPQSIHHGGEETTLAIGERNTIREGVTMNTGTTDGGGKTVVGDDNLFLAYSHVAHDCIARQQYHPVQQRHAGRPRDGRGPRHPRRRFGRPSVHAASAARPLSAVFPAVAYDVIPYGMLNGNPGILGGLNVVGMSRAGMDKPTIHRVRRAYKQIFEGEGSITDQCRGRSARSTRIASR